MLDPLFLLPVAAAVLLLVLAYALLVNGQHLLAIVAILVVVMFTLALVGRFGGNAAAACSAPSAQPKCSDWPATRMHAAGLKKAHAATPTVRLDAAVRLTRRCCVFVLQAWLGASAGR